MKSADFLPEEFPILIEALHPETRAVVWQLRVEQPASGTKALIYIPPLARQLGHRIAMRITFATGEVQEEQ